MSTATLTDTGVPSPWPARLARLYLLACVLALLLLLAVQGEALATLHPQAPIWFAPALLLAALAHAFSVAFIRGFAASVHAPLSAQQASEVHLRFLPSRYLPGGIWHTVGRVEQLRRAGLPLARATLLPLAESLAAVASTALAAALLLGLAPTTSQWAIGSLVLIAICGWAASALGDTRPATLGRTALAMLGFWTCQQLAFGCFLLALSTPGIAPVQATGSWALAWAAGHLAVFAPQGLGVAEVVYARLLGAGFDAALVVLAFRLLQAVADLLAWTTWRIRHAS